jgi:hypothetical protein
MVVVDHIIGTIRLHLTKVFHFAAIFLPKGFPHEEAANPTPQLD